MRASLAMLAIVPLLASAEAWGASDSPQPAECDRTEAAKAAVEGALRSFLEGGLTRGELEDRIRSVVGDGCYEAVVLIPLDEE